MTPLDKFIRVRIIYPTGLADEIISPDPKSGKPIEMPFQIEKSEKRDPDKCKVSIYCAGASKRSRIVDLATGVEVYASHDSPIPPMIFKGEMKDPSSGRTDDYVDFETVLDAEDTKSEMRTIVVSQTFAAGTPYTTLFQALAAPAKLAPDVIAPGKLNAAFTVIAPTRDAIAQACRRFGFRYQVVNHRLVVRLPDVPSTTGQVPLIASATGLIGSPTSEKQRGKVTVSFKTKLNPQLVPGGLCLFQLVGKVGSRKAPIKSGVPYWIERVTHTNEEGATMITSCTCREF